MIKDYAVLAENKLISAKLSGQRQVYVFFEISPPFDYSERVEEMAYRKFAHLGIGGFNNTPPIPLPNGDFLFYCLMSVETLTKLLSIDLIKERYRGDSFDQLFYDDYEYFKYVFTGSGERMGLTGKMEHFYGNIAEFVPGDNLKEIQPRGVFSGGPSFHLKPTLEIKERLVPSLKTICKTKDINTQNYYYFLINDFGVPLEESSHFDLEFGIQWWPSISFPAKDIVLDEALSKFGEHIPQSFTGVLLVPKNTSINDYREKINEFEGIQKKIRRMRTYLNIIYSANLKILGEIEIGENSTGNYFRKRTNLIQQNYRSWFKNFIISHSLFPIDALIESIKFSFRDLTKKDKFLFNLHRSIDSLDLARTISGDPLVSHVLIWAAIESLISPSNDSELISNMTLSLIGLNEDIVDKSSFWKQCKESYACRSKIVHSFDIPEMKDLVQHISFAESQCVALIKKIISDVIPLNKNRDDFISELRNNALK